MTGRAPLAAGSALVRALLWAACLLASTATAQDAGPDVQSPTTDEDQRLEQRLSGLFSQVDEFSDLEVSVENGVVHLSGAASSTDSHKAAELAGSLDGVLYVSSAIEQHTDLRRQLLPTLERMAASLRGLLAGLPLLLVALLIFAAFWVAAYLMTRSDVVVRRLSKRRLVQDLLRQILWTLLLVGGAFVALDILGATAVVGAVLGAAGVMGLALSFAFRDIVENYLASILLSIRSPFAANDVVEINGQLGVVVRLTTSETMLMSFDGNHVRLPNATVFKATIVNITRNPLRRFDFSVGVGVDEDLEQAQALALDTMRRLPSILDDPGPFALVDDLGDSSVALRFFGWIDQRASDFAKVRSQAIRLVKTVLDDHGVTMPSPIFDIILHGGSVTAGAGEDRDAGRASRDKRRSTEQALAEAQLADTSPETEIHEQIREEKATSDEADLLDDQATAAPAR